MGEYDEGAGDTEEYEEDDFSIEEDDEKLLELIENAF
jgi:hypothetical protein